MPNSTTFAAAAARARRPAFETPPAPRPRRSRLLLVGLPVFAVFAAFGAIVWLAYDHGADIPPVGEPPLIKAPATALKLPPDEAGAPAVADQGEVRDLLSDAPPGDEPEQLLPSPETPLAPAVATDTPPPTDSDAGDTAAPPPPPPGDTAAVEPAPPPEVAPPPVQVAPLPPQTARRPRPLAAPDRFTAPDRFAATPGRGDHRRAAAAPAPVVVERQPGVPSAAKPPVSAPQPSPREAEAALDALLAEVTRPTASPPTRRRRPPMSSSRRRPRRSSRDRRSRPRRGRQPPRPRPSTPRPRRARPRQPRPPRSPRRAARSSRLRRTGRAPAGPPARPARP